MDSAIGIVIAAYNAEATLHRAIDSVLSQSSPNWKLIVIDDGSSDATWNIASKYARADKRISLIRQENSGAAAARNAGMHALGTCWATYLDADDEFAPQFIEKMLNALHSNPGYDYYTSNAVLVNPDGEMGTFRKQTESRQIKLSEMLEKCVMTGAGTLKRVQIFIDDGGFDASLLHAEDYCYWLRTMAQGKKVWAISDKLYYYHIFEGGVNKSSHIYGRVNAFNQIQSLIEDGSLSEDEQLSANLGQERLSQSIVNSFLSFDKERRAEILNDDYIPEDIRQALQKTGRPRFLKLSDRIQFYLNAWLGKQLGSAIWNLIYTPYSMAKTLLLKRSLK